METGASASQLSLPGSGCQGAQRALPRHLPGGPVHLPIIVPEQATPTSSFALLPLASLSEQLPQLSPHRASPALLERDPASQGQRSSFRHPKDPELTHLFCSFYTGAGGHAPRRRIINRPQALGMFRNAEESHNPQSTAMSSL